MKAFSSFKLNRTALRTIDKAAARALAKTAEALHTEVVQAQVVPRDTGRLQNTAFYIDDSRAMSGEVRLVQSTPYARRLYFHPEYNFHQHVWTDGNGRHEGNAHAKGHWFEDWLRGGTHEDFAVMAFATMLRREGSDVIE